MGKIRPGSKLKNYYSGEWRTHGRKFWKRVGNKAWRRFNKNLCKKELNES